MTITAELIPVPWVDTVTRGAAGMGTQAAWLCPPIHFMSLGCRNPSCEQTFPVSATKQRLGGGSWERENATEPELHGRSWPAVGLEPQGQSLHLLWKGVSRAWAPCLPAHCSHLPTHWPGGYWAGDSLAWEGRGAGAHESREGILFQMPQVSPFLLVTVPNVTIWIHSPFFSSFWPCWGWIAFLCLLVCLLFFHYPLFTGWEAIPSISIFFYC